MDAWSAWSSRPLRSWVPAVAWMLAAAWTALLVFTTHGAQNALPALVLLMIVVLALRRRPLAGLLLTMLVAVVLTLVTPHTSVGWTSALAIDVAIGVLAHARTWPVSAAGAAAALLVQLLMAPLFRGSAGYLPRTLEIIPLALVCAWTIGNSLGERQRRNAQLRIRDTEQAVADERLRIARDVHDLVAHSLGVIAIQAGVGARVIETQPGEAGNALRAIESTSRQTLAELRRTLGSLRRSDPEGAPAGPTPGLADLDTLVARAADADVRVDLERAGTVRELPDDLELHAYRIVQEAVTNVVRHAATDHCRVRLDYRTGELGIEVLDDGPGTGTPGIGFGLVGMRERATLLDGDFSATARPEGGFRVTARIPTPAAG